MLTMISLIFVILDCGAFVFLGVQRGVFNGVLLGMSLCVILNFLEK